MQCSLGHCPGISDIFSGGPLSSGLLFMLADSIIYFWIGLYLDNILPPPWGIRKSPLFCLKPVFDLVRSVSNKIFSCFKRKKTKPLLGDEISINRYNTQAEIDYVLNMKQGENLELDEEDADVNFERQRALGMNGKDAPIVIKHLKKIYKGKKEAISDLCLALAKGTCFGLLGPNGAGKSRAIIQLIYSQF